MSALSPVFRLVMIAAAWVGWLLPFVAARKRAREQAARIDPRARRGIVLEMAGFFCALTHGPRTWGSELAVWRAVAGTAFAIIAIALGWSAVTNLGRQWRIDAGLNADHELVQTGAYRIVRHPIYASMLGMLLAAVCWVGTLPGWPLAIVLFLAGTEIRVRVEDALLYERFGERFAEWQKAVPAYLPFVR